MNVDLLLIIMLAVMGVLGYFYGLMAALLVGIVGLGLLLNKLFTQLKAVRLSLLRWDNVVDKFETALGSPIDQARKGQ